jgi:hypothetical protein
MSFDRLGSSPLCVMPSGVRLAVALCLLDEVFGAE